MGSEIMIELLCMPTSVSLSSLLRPASGNHPLLNGVTVLVDYNQDTGAVTLLRFPEEATTRG